MTWKVDGVTSVHGRSRPGAEFLQIARRGPDGGRGGGSPVPVSVTLVVASSTICAAALAAPMASGANRTPTLQQVLEERDPERQLRVNARNSREGKLRIAALAEVIRSARPSTPTSRRSGTASTPNTMPTSARSWKASTTRERLTPGSTSRAAATYSGCSTTPTPGNSSSPTRVDTPAVRAMGRRHRLRTTPRPTTLAGITVRQAQTALWPRAPAFVSAARPSLAIHESAPRHSPHVEPSCTPPTSR